MLTLALRITGWVLAHTPEGCLQVAAAALGELLWWLEPRRRRLVLSNLRHAFPDRPDAWRRRTARTCSHRLVETGMLSLATPYLSERRIRAIARLAPSVENWARDRAVRPRPVVFGTLHLALWESQTWLKLLSPVPLPEFGIIYRPLDNAGADAYVRRTREHFGMRLLSRKAGFAEALRILRTQGCIGLLFDQNAGNQGALTLLFGRVCSTTELPGLLATKMDAEVRTFFPRRTGFWRVAFESDPIAHDGTAAGVTLAFNRWLEAALTADDDLCASWLWAHDRWRHQDVPARRFHLESKRDLLAPDLRGRQLSALPRRLQVWVRLPNWLGDIAMTLPLLRALRASRPDAAIILIAGAPFLPLLATWKVADRLEALPPRGWGYFRHFRRLRDSYPDVWLLFTQSVRGDLEAWLAGAPQRFGVVRPGRRRPLLTDAWSPPRDFAAAHPHQFELWTEFLRSFGLNLPPDLTPLPLSCLAIPHGPSDPVSRCLGGASPAPSGSREGRPIGLIPGSENSPEKRWPVGHWRRLIELLPGERFVLFGTVKDATITEAIAAGLPPQRVEDLAGKTDLNVFANCLRTCRLLVTNDTGGMHLANALGVPLVALFGPTNPLHTGPVFAAPTRILQPPGCPPAGGAALASLPPEAVLAAIAEMKMRI